MERFPKAEAGDDQFPVALPDGDLVVLATSEWFVDPERIYTRIGIDPGTGSGAAVVGG